MMNNSRTFWGHFRDKNVHTMQPFRFDDKGMIVFSEPERISNNNLLPKGYCQGVNKKKYLRSVE